MHSVIKVTKRKKDEPVGELVARVCTTCGVFKAAEHFYSQAVGFGGRMACCKPCHANRGRKVVNNLPHAERVHRQRQQRLKQHYEMTPEQYKEMQAQQDNKCAICGVQGGADTYTEFLAVDHCHKTGQIRGLLCRKCNTGIAMFKDSPDILSAAIKYVQRFV